MKNFSYFTMLDLKYTLRLLSKRPGSTLLCVLVLACGLGVSIFTLTTAYTLAYKEIPIPEGETVVRLCTGDIASPCGPFRARELFEMRSELSSLSEISVTTAAEVFMEVGSYGLSLIASQVEPTLFSLSRTPAFIGRTLQDYDSSPGTSPVALLSFDTWRTVFDSNPNVTDQIVNIDGTQRSVVGVMPPEFRFPANSQVWLPIERSSLLPLQNDQSFVTAYARLSTSYTQVSATGQINNLMKAIRERNPLSENEYGAMSFNQIANANVTSLPMALLGGRTGVLALMAINVLSGLIFLLVCINVGTLLLARVNERIRDISIRVALGAPLPRLLTQTMSENLLISVAGGVIAVFFAGFFLELLNWFIASTVKEEAPFWFKFSIDASTIIGVIIFVIATIILTCVIPSLKIINGDFNSVMRDGTRGAIGFKAGKASRNIVIAAISLISLLLYAGSLAGSSAMLMKGVFSDRDTSNLIGADLSIPQNRYSSNQRLQILGTLQQQLSQSGLVEEALIFGEAGRIDVAMSSNQEQGATYSALVQATMGDLQAVDATLYEGRYINERDSVNAPSVVVISRSLAEKLWPSESAVDKQIWLNRDGFDAVGRRVVGVVGNTLISGQTILSPQTDTIYVPLGQSPWIPVKAYVRFSGDIGLANSYLRQSVLSNGFEPPIQVVRFDADQESALKALNSGLTLIISCGLFAFMIALTGVYGLTSNAVMLRTQEIGTRRALGATDSEISRKFLLNGLMQVLVGMGISIMICLPVTYLVFSSASPEFMRIAIPLLGSSFGVLVLSLLVAVYLPIRKILQMEPVEALRYQ